MPVASVRNENTATHYARWVLTSFLVTFMAARVIVLLIATHRIPDLFLYVGGTHVHHLNYGIFLLSGVGAYLLFANPVGSRLTCAAFAYGVGLGLTFDEFGMWLHLSDDYWQRASLDAVGVIAASLALLAFAPRWREFRPRHWPAVAVLAAVFVIFAVLVLDVLFRRGTPVAPG